MKKCAWIVLFGLLAAVPAFGATEVKDGQQWLYGPTGAPIMVNDSGTGRALAGDSEGRLLSASPYATGGLVIVAWTSTVGGAIANTSTPTAPTNLVPYDMSAQHGSKWMRLSVSGAPTNSPPWSVRFYGSRDGVTYAPIVKSVTTSTATSGANLLGSTTVRDTLKWVGRGAMSSMWFKLAVEDDGQIPLNYITAVCSVDSTQAAAAYVITVEVAGREQ